MIPGAVRADGECLGWRVLPRAGVILRGDRDDVAGCRKPSNINEVRISVLGACAERPCVDVGTIAYGLANADYDIAPVGRSHSMCLRY